MKLTVLGGTSLQQDMGPAMGAVTDLPTQVQVWGLGPCPVNFGWCEGSGRKVIFPLRKSMNVVTRRVFCLRNHVGDMMTFFCFLGLCRAFGLCGVKSKL